MNAVLTVDTLEVPPDLGPPLVRGVLVQPVISKTRSPDAQLEDEVRAITGLGSIRDRQETRVGDVDKIDRLIETLRTR